MPYHQAYQPLSVPRPSPPAGVELIISAFLRSLPKAELHAHLNGCIPLGVLQELAADRPQDEEDEEMNEIVQAGLVKLKQGVTLDRFQEYVRLPSSSRLRSVDLLQRLT